MTVTVLFCPTVCDKLPPLLWWIVFESKSEDDKLDRSTGKCHYFIILYTFYYYNYFYLSADYIAIVDARVCVGTQKAKWKTPKPELYSQESNTREKRYFYEIASRTTALTALRLTPRVAV